MITVSCPASDLMRWCYRTWPHSPWWPYKSPSYNVTLPGSPTFLYLTIVEAIRLTDLSLLAGKLAVLSMTQAAFIAFILTGRQIPQDHNSENILYTMYTDGIFHTQHTVHVLSMMLLSTWLWITSIMYTCTLHSILSCVQLTQLKDKTHVWLHQSKVLFTQSSSRTAWVSSSELHSSQLCPHLTFSSPILLFTHLNMNQDLLYVSISRLLM